MKNSIEQQLKECLQQAYKNSDSFLRDIIFPVFGEENYESAGNLNVLRKRPDLQHKADASGIMEIHQVGGLYVEGSQLDIFDVTLDYKKQLRSNRVEIQQIIRSILGTHSGAFIIFHYESGARWEWRFTFCHKGASQVDSSDAKRYTFLLGPGQSCRTAAENFMKIHNKIEREGEFEMDDIIKAFDVEALSKEFFDKYKAQYEKFCQFVYDHKNEPEWFGHEFAEWEDKTIRDYVKKLLGRIVFLHFLQKKGWLGVPATEVWGNGDVQFMKHLFDNATEEQKANYLDEVLEPLFHYALNSDRKDNDNLFNTGVEGFHNVKIPYLNGGLFERDVLDEPDSVFPAHFFKDLLEFLYEYNFTIDENDPSDAEVGIDPEMLGRIFENLLEDNKDKGAFYTPKEIVQYMCRESLIAYLTTHSIEHGNTNPRDKVETAVRQLVLHPEDIVPRMSAEHKETFGNALRNVKICDPAIGSGAFPMGLLNELVRCRVAIDAWAKDDDGNLMKHDYASLKREIVCNNIYGVDIERGAIDIARLRFWLSIVVDEQTPHTLPNLDYKFMQGNSLISTFDGEYVNLSTGGDNIHGAIAKMIYEKKHLYGLKQQYYSAIGEEKHKLGVAIKDSILQLISLQLGSEIKSWYDNRAKTDDLFAGTEYAQATMTQMVSSLPESKKRIVEHGQEIRNRLHDVTLSYAERDQTDIRFFDWRIMFTEVFEGEKPGFDIVIGNPPYIQLQADNGLLGKIYQSKGFETFNSMGDIYCLFYEQGVNLLRGNGTLCYITSNNWMRTNYGENLRAFFSRHNPLLLVNFVDLQIFDTATVETNILLLQKSANAGMSQCAMLDSINNLSEAVESKSNITAFLDSSAWVVLKNEEAAIKQKFLNSGKLLGECDVNIVRGILTGYNDAFVVTTEIRNQIISRCTTEEEIRKTEALIVPTLRGRDIKRYGSQWAGLWLINTHNGKRGSLAPIDIEEYPSVKAHLDGYWSKISKRGDKGVTPYNLRNCAYLDDLTAPKIAWIELSDTPKFTFTTDEIPLNTVFFMVGKELKYLLGLLNSKAIYWYFTKMLGCTSGMGTNRWLKFTMVQLPIPQVNHTQQLPIITLVERILAAKKANPLADTTAEECEIDRLVYDLYGLTEDEIAIVEGTN